MQCSRPMERVGAMITEKVQEALNNQLNAEFYSAHLYLSMSAWFDSAGLKGFASWMQVQFQEEESHALKIYKYILERGGNVVLKPIDAPPCQWDSPLAVFEATLEHEQKVTRFINDMVYLARQERDNACEIFLQWFVNEQVEEEDNVGSVLAQLRLIKDSPQSLFIMDKDMAQRVFTPPATEN